MLAAKTTMLASLAYGYVDGFFDASGIDTASASYTYNASLKAASGPVAVETTQSLPAQTSDTAPTGYTASASSEFSSGYVAADAFDQSSTSSWSAATTSFPQYIQRQYPSPVVFGAYSIQSRADTNANNPSAWVLAGSNDGSTWTTLDSQTAQTFASAGTVNRYSIANVTAYSYYRLTVSAGSGTLAIGELGLYQRIPGALDLKTVAVTLAAVPVNASLAMLLTQASGATAITANTSLVAYISRNGGGNYGAMTLTLARTFPNGVQLWVSNYFSIAGLTSGQSLKLRVTATAPNAVSVLGIVLRGEPS